MGRCVRFGADTLRPLAAVLLGSLLFLLPIFAGVAGVSAAEDEAKVDACSLWLTDKSVIEIADTYRSLARSEKEKKDPRRELQRGLEAVFRDNPVFMSEFKDTRLLNDGKIGKETLKWLRRFCREFPGSGSPGSLLESVVRYSLHYGEIEAAHGDWWQTVTSSRFDAWVRDPPGDGYINTRQMRRSGTAPVVIRLLDDFASPVVEGEKSSGGAYDESCLQLLEEGAVDRILGELKRLDRFKNKGKGLREELERGLDAVFAANPQCSSRRERTLLISDGPIGMDTGKQLERFCRDFPVSGPLQLVPLRVVESALHYAEIAAARPDWRKVLADPEFNQWLRNPVPAGGQPRNRPLRLSGSAPIVIKLINEYSGTLVPPPQQAGDACPPALGRGAEVYYELSAPDLERLKGRADFLSQVKELMGKEFATSKQLVEAIEPTPDFLKDDCVRKKFLQSIRESKGSGEPTSADRKEENRGGSGAEEKPAYKITDEAVAVLNRDPLFLAFPDDVLEGLTSLRGVAYVNDRLFKTAVRSVLTPVLSLETTTQCPREPIEGEEGQYAQAAAIQARKVGQAKSPLRLEAADCGCAREWDSVGNDNFIVYGFYPFWMSAGDAETADPDGGDGPSEQAEGNSKEQDVGDAVPFSILSRIGYFALELNENGEIPERRLWTKEGPKDFIAKAHRYRSQVDLVIEAPYWKSWNDTTREQAVEQAVDSIWELLTPSLPTEMRPDGVTLYFPGFADAGSDSKSQENIVKLVEELHWKLHPEEGSIGQEKKKAGPLREMLDALGGERALSLNILIDAENLKNREQIHPTGEHGLLHGLKDILDKKVDLVLVFLDQPVTTMKKRLRLAVENEFEGEQRRSILRKILPVIPPNGHERQTKKRTVCNDNDYDAFWQLQHNLVYFRDNFRGVAFWPLPTTTTTKTKDLDVLKSRLKCTFAESEKPGDVIDRFLDSLVPGLCKSVCPNRKAFGIAFFVLAGLLILLALLAYWNCRVRSALAKRFWYVMGSGALLIVLFVALVDCDPVWNELEETIVIGLVVLLIGSWLFHYIRKVKQGLLP